MAYLDILKQLGANTSNISLLALFYSFIPNSFALQHPKLFQFSMGIIGGLLCISCMFFPIIVYPGVLLDGRSVVTPLVGFFFGPISAIITVLIAGIYRISIGGVGVVSGLFLLVSTAILGVLSRHFYHKRLISNEYLLFILLGLFVAADTVLAILFFPNHIALTILQNVWLSLVVVYPIGVLFAGSLVSAISARNSNVAQLDKTAHELQCAKEEQGKSLQLIKSISRNLTAGMIYRIYIKTDGTKYFTYLSDSVENLYGITAQQAIEDHKLIYNKILVEDLPPILHAENYAMETLTTFKVECRMFNPDGSIRWSTFEAEPRVIDHETICFDGIEFIITDRILQKNEALYRAIFEKSFDAISIADVHGRYKYINPAFCEMTGYSPHELLKLTVFDISRKPRKFRMYNDIIDRDESMTTVAILTRKDGSEFSAEIKGTTIYIDGEKMVLGILKDISVSQRTEQELVKAKNNAEETLAKLQDTQQQLITSEKISSIGFLSSGIAHEINNPINVVSSGISSLRKWNRELVSHIECLRNLDRTDIVTQYHDYLKLHNSEIDCSIDFNQRLIKSMDSAIERTLGILKNMRALSSISELTFVSIDVNTVLEFVLSVAVPADCTGINIRKQFADDSLVMGLYSSLHQVFVNLILNALQAMDGCGELVIGTSWKDNKQTLCVSIKDSGCGIAPEIINKIYDPFFTTKEVGKGTGLGLYLTHTIIEAHNGKIHVNSAPNVGAEFIVELPSKQ